MFDEGDGTWTTVDAIGRPELQVQAFPKDQEITYDVVLKRLDEVLMTRGKKGKMLAEQTLLLLQIEEKISKCSQLLVGVDRLECVFVGCIDRLSQKFVWTMCLDWKYLLDSTYSPPN